MANASNNICDVKQQTKYGMRKKPKREKKTDIFLNAAYSNPVVWNTDEPKCIHLLNCECFVCLYSISTIEMYCILATIFFLLLIHFRWANNAGLLPETMISHSLHTIHKTLYTIPSTMNSIKNSYNNYLWCILYMQCIRNGAIPWKCFLVYLEHMRHAYGSGRKYAQEPNISEFRRKHAYTEMQQNVSDIKLYFKSNEMWPKYKHCECCCFCWHFGGRTGICTIPQWINAGIEKNKLMIRLVNFLSVFFSRWECDADFHTVWTWT